MRPKPRTRRKPYELLFLPKHHGDELVNVHLELFRGVLDFLRRLDGEFDEDVAKVFVGVFLNTLHGGTEVALCLRRDGARGKQAVDVYDVVSLSLIHI